MILQKVNKMPIQLQHGRIVARSEREKRLLRRVISNLEQYKYKKDVALFQINQKLFERFMESLDVK